MFCIAPGCSNSFYKTKDRETHVHYHNLPLKRPSVLRRWLTVMKRKTPPVNSSAKVCSDHFVDDDYVEEKFFNEEGRLATRKKKLLKREACPSVFDFSAYNFRTTHRPTQQATSPAAVLRTERAKRRAYVREQSKVVIIILAANVKLTALHKPLFSLCLH